MTKIFPLLVLALLCWGCAVSRTSARPPRALVNDLRVDWESETVTLSLEDYTSLYFELRTYREGH